MKLKSLWWGVVALICVLVVVGANFLRQHWDAKPIDRPDFALTNTVEPRPPIEPPSLSEALGVSEEDMVEVGGIARPKRDLANGESKIDLVAVRKQYLASRKKVSYAPPVKAEDSEAAAALQ